MNEKTKFLLLIFVGKGWTQEEVVNYVRKQTSSFVEGSKEIIDFVVDQASRIYSTNKGHGLIDIELVIGSGFRIRYDYGDHSLCECFYMNRGLA